MERSGVNPRRSPAATARWPVPELFRCPLGGFRVTAAAASSAWGGGRFVPSTIRPWGWSGREHGWCGVARSWWFTTEVAPRWLSPPGRPSPTRLADGIRYQGASRVGRLILFQCPVRQLLTPLV